MEKKDLIYICTKVLAGIAIAFGVFAAIPMIMLAWEIIGSRMAPETMELPFPLKRFGLDGLETNNPGILTTYVVTLTTTLLAATYALMHVLFRTTCNRVKAMGKIELIVTGAVFGISLCVLIPTTKTVLKESKHALEAKQEDRNSYMGIQMDELSKSYLSKNGWSLTKHENCFDNYVRKGEYYTGDQDVAYLDAWNPNGQQLYQAEKSQPVEAGTYRIICSARAEGPGCYIFAKTTSNSVLKFVEIPHYGNTEGEIWENAPEGSAERDVNMGNGFGWSKVVVTVEIKEHDTLIYGVTTDQKFSGKACKSQWFSAADFEVERLGIN
ncbi:hypothetical protein [Prevotella sp. P6B1]|uniref:hypothetical protein n=1 Tax=Prevotella sp. P6B1 TaxID=1410613 RepID=UPI00051B7593|nr:hypothetical protein [Prevotella sp. P6B1]